MDWHDRVSEGFLRDLEMLCKKWDTHDRQVVWDVTEDFIILITVPSPDGNVTNIMLPYNRPFEEVPMEEDRGEEWM